MGSDVDSIDQRGEERDDDDRHEAAVRTPRHAAVDSDRLPIAVGTVEPNIASAN
jgi:hypothetical protein